MKKSLNLILLFAWLGGITTTYAQNAENSFELEIQNYFQEQTLSDLVFSMKSPYTLKVKKKKLPKRGGNHRLQRDYFAYHLLLKERKLKNVEMSIIAFPYDVHSFDDIPFWKNRKGFIEQQIKSPDGENVLVYTSIDRDKEQEAIAIKECVIKYDRVYYFLFSVKAKDNTFPIHLMLDSWVKSKVKVITSKFE